MISDKRTFDSGRVNEIIITYIARLIANNHISIFILDIIHLVCLTYIETI